MNLLRVYSDFPNFTRRKSLKLVDVLKYLNMVEHIGEIKKIKILKTGFETSDEAYPMGHYLDEDAYNKEQADFSKVRKYLSERLTSKLTFKSKAAHDQWAEQAGHPMQIHSSVKDIQTAFDDTMLKGTIIGNDLTNLLSVTRELMTLEVLEEQRKISKGNDFYENEFKLYEQPMIFDLCGNLLMKVKGLSILDIVREKKTSPVDYYDCQINAFIAKRCLNHDEVLSENRNQLTDLYPNKSRQLIEEGLGGILGITDLSPQLVDNLFRFITPKDTITSEIIQKVKNIVKQANTLEQRIFNSILNPNSEDFLPLKEKYEKYFNSDNPTIKLLALKKLGLREKSRIIMAYRKAKKLASENGEQSQFYDKLAETIKKVNIEESPLGVNTLTHDDVIMFLNGDSTSSSTSFEELRKLRMEILPKLSKDEYVINPSEIEWQGLIKPTSISFKFNRDFQSRFKVAFYYENDEGEEAELNFDIDTKSKKESIDWNFLESPDDPEMKEMKNAVMLSVESVLQDVKRQTMPLTQQYPDREKDINTSPLLEVKSERVKEKVWVPREKFKKQEHAKPFTSVDEVLQSEIVPIVKNGIKRRVVIPKNTEEIRPKDIDRAKWAMLMRRIERFNRDGLGSFEMIEKTKHNKMHLYRLKISKEFRFILTRSEHENDDGPQLYKFYKVIRRNDEYREI